VGAVRVTATPIGEAGAGRSWAPIAVGLVAWGVAMLVLPAPLAARILLLAPLVIVPRVIAILPARPWLATFAGWPAVVAALPLLVAVALPTGPLAAVFAVPWLCLALAGTFAAVAHGLSVMPSLLRLRDVPALGADVALGFWGVGAGFVVIERLGVDIGFSPAIVLLTATHFHFAGFGLLAVASLSSMSRPWLRVSVLGLIAGIPMTALGFVLASDAINAVGAAVVGSSGIGVAVALLTGPAGGWRRWASRLAGVALLVGMPMGIAWSLAILAGQRFLDLDSMIRTHGVLNSAAVLLAVVAYRSADASSRTATREPVHPVNQPANDCVSHAFWCTPRTKRRKTGRFAQDLCGP
jgi:hypothetical protein